jgi:hypothetical protein
MRLSKHHSFVLRVKQRRTIGNVVTSVHAYI